MTDRWTLVLHGGAGVNPGRDYSEVEAHLLALVTEGAARLDAGASALDTVEWAVARLEASGLYVAGRGSAPNRDGVVEFDAAIMDGAGPRAGAVAAIQDVQSPIGAARAVMDKTPNVLLVGAGATAFAHEAGLPAIGARADFFRVAVGVEPAEMAADELALGHGTVGAVALDRTGRLAAATSTGGLFGKRPGRVGDTALPGSGTWADAGVAISCTGVGEHLILAGGAGDIAAHMRYGSATAREAADAMLARVAALGGDGGLIALGPDGTPVFAWNSGGLKRAAAGSHCPPMSAIA
ncbi:MAG: isoaspartyl peptidase/L-asparaginase family protein [Sandaracinobacteroides sp.]